MACSFCVLQQRKDLKKITFLQEKVMHQNAASTANVTLSSADGKVSGGVLRGGSELTSGSLSGLP